MSAIKEALKETNEVFFIVRAIFGGRDYWWSTKNLTIPYSTGDNIHVDGIMLQTPSFSQSLDIRSLRASVPSVQITLANSDRLQDIESIVELDNSYVDLFVWCDGLDFSEIETDGILFRGLFQKEYHDRFRFVFSIVDLLKQEDMTIPPNLVHIGSWPNLRLIGGGGSVGNRPEPIIFGEFDKGIPLLCVDTTGFKYLICNHTIKSVDGDFTAATENVYDKDGAVVDPAGYEYLSGYDGYGNIVSYLDFTADKVASEPLTCSLKGKIDDAAGTYTGTGSALIELPGSILHCLLSVYTKTADARIDVTSLKTINNTIPGAKMAMYINDQVTTSDIIDRLCSQIIAFRGVYPGGKIGATALDFNGNIRGYLNCKDDAIGTPRFTRTPLDSVVNNLLIQYAYNPETRTFEKLLVRNRNNNDACKLSYYDYGEMPQKTISLYDVQTNATAHILTARYLDLYSKRRHVLEASFPWALVFDYKLGDVVGITSEDGPSTDGTGWTEKPCILIEKNYQGNVVNCRFMEV